MPPDSIAPKTTIWVCGRKRYSPSSARNFALKLDIAPRLQYHITRFNEFHIRTFVGYQAKPWLQLTIGAYPWAPTFQATYRNQTRFLEQITLEKARGPFRFGLRSRLEQRWLAHTNGKTSVRLREMVRVNYFVNKKRTRYVWVANELFINLNDISEQIPELAGITQNRLYGGVGFRVARHLQMEVAYLDQWQHRRYHVTNLPNRNNHNIFINLVTNF